MRYTAEAAMEERTLRDVERWKEKIEVRLDNRQVFFLFFGSALTACLLFILGVIVGKRLETRGRAAAAPEIEDPLALLDRIATTPPAGGQSLGFSPKALMGNSKPGSLAKLPPMPAPKPAPVVAKVTPPVVAAPPPAPVAPVAAAAPKPAPAAAPVPAPSKPVALAAAPKPAASPIPAKPATEPPAAPSAAPVAAAAPSPAKEPAEAPAPEPKPAPEAKPAAVAGVIPVTPAPKKLTGRFTLQISSFQDRAEAEAFAKRFGDARPYIIISNLPGKGTWFRVRAGDYGSLKEAMTAKDVFEKQHNAIAYVAPR